MAEARDNTRPPCVKIRHIPIHTERGRRSVWSSSAVHPVWHLHYAAVYDANLANGQTRVLLVGGLVTGAGRAIGRKRASSMPVMAQCECRCRAMHLRPLDHVCAFSTQEGTRIVTYGALWVLDLERRGRLGDAMAVMI